MNKSIVSDGQSLVDVALQEYGTVAALFDLADASGLAITDQLSAGQALELPASEVAYPALVSYFLNRSQRINTGDEPTAAPAPANIQRYFSSLFFNSDTYA